MATTVTTISATVSASAQFIKLAAYTAPSGRAKALGRFDDEIVLITDTTNSPTIGVVRGYMGTAAVAHEAATGFEYGTPSDMQTAKGPSFQSASLAQPAIFQNAQEITTTGATGSTAAIVTVSSPAFLNLTGATSSGVNLPVPSVGEAFILNNKTTGAIKIYCVGGTINGTTGTTAFSLTATGNLMATAFCSTAGAWQIAGNT